MSSINPEITSLACPASYAQSSFTQATTEIGMLRIMRMTRVKSPTVSLQSDTHSTIRLHRAQPGRLGRAVQAAAQESVDGHTEIRRTCARLVLYFGPDDVFGRDASSGRLPATRRLDFAVGSGGEDTRRHSRGRRGYSSRPQASANGLSSLIRSRNWFKSSD